MSVLRIYGDRKSGNCLKVLWTAQRTGRAFEWIDIDILQGQSRTPEFLARNAAGQVPTVVLEDGRPLAQSNAIILHLAEGTDLIPDDPYERAKMFEWLFWEQYSHEPAIASRRFRKAYLQQSDAEIDPQLLTKGERALAILNDALDGRDFLVGARLSAADIALVAYTRVAHEGGFNLTGYPNVVRWIGAVERELGLEPAREAA